jgi:hypothetical protein
MYVYTQPSYCAPVRRETEAAVQEKARCSQSGRCATSLVRDADRHPPNSTEGAPDCTSANLIINEAKLLQKMTGIRQTDYSS